MLDEISTTYLKSLRLILSLTMCYPCDVNVHSMQCPSCAIHVIPICFLVNPMCAHVLSMWCHVPCDAMCYPCDITYPCDAHLLSIFNLMWSLIDIHAIPMCYPCDCHATCMLKFHYQPTTPSQYVHQMFPKTYKSQNKENIISSMFAAAGAFW